MKDGEATPKKYRGLKAPWKPGQSGNPKGRPKGSRNQFCEAFIADLHDAWKQRGAEAIQSMIDDKPGDFVKVAAGLLPKDFNINTNVMDDLTDDELAATIDTIKSLIAASGVKPADERSPAETKH